MSLESFNERQPLVSVENLISVIIPVYNAAPYIERCLRSVVKQTYRNLEIIVVNDGSTDGTDEILDQFAGTDDRIVVIHKKNTGVSDTRNKGLDFASGDYIGFVDGDDEVYPDMFEFLLGNALKYNADISHCGFELVNPDQTIAINGTGEIVIQNRKESIASLLQGKLFEPSNCNKLFKREVLGGVSYASDVRINEDLLFNVESFNQCNCAIYEDVVKYRYMYNPSSVARSGFDLSKQRDVLTVARRIKDYLANEPDLTREVECFYAEKLLILYRTLYENRELDNELSTELRRDLKKIKGVNVGLRFMLLRALLLDFSPLYKLSRAIYNRLFSYRQKWKIPEHE
ncbi:glycosyltransferase [Akkermansiaceae bacterium]|nr:glycosyltransferase [Akkermansiaceae bacterium]